MSHRNTFKGLPARRPVRFRVFDGRHEVLRKRDIIRIIDLSSPFLQGQLAGILDELIETASVLENERLVHPRLEVWCSQSGRKVADYLGGMV